MNDSSYPQGQSCNYSTLASYNNSGPSFPKARPTKGVYVVPAFTQSGYSTLTHDNSNTCGGYFDISDAYGRGANTCNQKYLVSACDNNIPVTVCGPNQYPSKCSEATKHPGKFVCVTKGNMPDANPLCGGKK